MITYKTGDMFKDIQPNDWIVNTVNCVGVMGKGIALQFKKRYPAMFQHYYKACLNGGVKIGSMLLYPYDNLTIVNFPTKKDWRRPSEYEYIYQGLIALKRVLIDYNVKSTIRIPALGCTNGGLDYDRVRDMITLELQDLKDIDIIVYEPHGEKK